MSTQSGSSSIWRKLLCRSKSVSPEILRTLRRTIKARNKIGMYFRKVSGEKQREANSSHSHFTSVLLGIYQNLCSLMVVDDKGALLSQNQTSPLESSNMFAWLCCEDDHKDHITNIGIDRELVDTRSVSPSRPRPPTEKVETHDVISEFMALSMYLSVRPLLIRQFITADMSAKAIGQAFLRCPGLLASRCCWGNARDCSFIYDKHILPMCGTTSSIPRRIQHQRPPDSAGEVRGLRQLHQVRRVMFSLQDLHRTEARMCSVCEGGKSTNKLVGFARLQAELAGKIYCLWHPRSLFT